MNLQLAYWYILSLSKNESMFKKKKKTTKKKEKKVSASGNRIPNL